MRPKLRSVGPDRNVQISPEDAASVLGISRRQVYRQLADGVIPCRRVGRRYVIFRADVDRLLRDGTAPTVTACSPELGPRDLQTLLSGGELVFEVRIRLKSPASP